MSTKAIALAQEHGISYSTGVELNVTICHTGSEKPVSLDFLGYRYDFENQALKAKLELAGKHREARARQILEKLNIEFATEDMPRCTVQDLKNIQGSVDGSIGMPHIANYLVQKGILKDKQEAFDKYLVRCDVHKYPLSLAEALILICNAGGILVLAHPNDPYGTSLANVTSDLVEQTKIIEKYMLEYIRGVECWQYRSDEKTTGHYVEFARKHHLVMTGRSHCHQKAIIMGTVDIPDWVA